MAKNKEEKIDERFQYKYKSDYQEDWDIHRNYINSFDAYEAMLIGEVYDSVSKSVDGSKITDSYAATLAKERADRVIAKLPSGNTEPMGKADVGKAAFMEVLRQKWIYPNANAQHSLEVKFNMWQLYSSVYGYMPMFYDWNVSNTGYIGPDCWLWNPRNLIPQQGRVSIKDMDYVTALTWVNRKYLEGILEKESEDDGWDRDAVKMLLEKVDNQTTDADSERDTRVERTRIAQATKRGICLATRYESGDEGKWITFAPDHSCIEVRNIDNPHKNGRIPFVIKYSQPLFDSFYGLGDFQRAKPLQFARDGLTNFYFKGIKLNLVQPIVANANGVLKHTLDYREGGVMMETIPNSIRTLNVSTAGLNTYQAAQQNLTGSLLSLYGTQNASIPGAEALNPEQGKTPAAINMYSSKEATRDGAERRHLEAAIEELTDGFFSLVANISTETIPITLFADDIKEIFEAGMEDVMGLFTAKFLPNESSTAGDLKIDPKALRGIEYRFNIDPNSTMKVNKEEQLEALDRLMDRIGKFQNIFKDDPRVEIDWPAIMDSYERLSDLKGVKDFVKIKKGPSPQEIQLMEQAQQLEQENVKLQQQMVQLQKSQVDQQTKEAELAAQPTVVGDNSFGDQDIAAAAASLVQ